MRFWNHLVVRNFEGVAEAVRLRLGAIGGDVLSPSPNPLPQAAEGHERAGERHQQAGEGHGQAGER
jgi:hypothetical protein